jgi:hypothetical protein
MTKRDGDGMTDEELLAVLGLTAQQFNEIFRDDMTVDQIAAVVASLPVDQEQK